MKHNLSTAVKGISYIYRENNSAENVYLLWHLGATLKEKKYELTQLESKSKALFRGVCVGEWVWEARGGVTRALI